MCGTFKTEHEFLYTLLACGVHTGLLSPDTSGCIHLWNRLDARCQSGTNLVNFASSELHCSIPTWDRIGDFPLPFVHICPVVSTSLKKRSQVRKQLGLLNPTVLTSVYRNCWLDLSKTNLAFNLWHTNASKSITNLYRNSVLSSFEQLSKKYNLPNQHLSVSSTSGTLLKTYFPNRPPEALLVALLSKDPLDLYLELKQVYLVMHKVIQYCQKFMGRQS